MTAPASAFSDEAARAWLRRREAMIDDMAQRLIDVGAFEPTAARDCLIGYGYGRHVELLLDRAICAAQLAAVDAAMLEPAS